MSDILRSEAHFAARMYGALTSDREFRSRFLTLIGNCAKRKVGETATVFVEPALFRDKWEYLLEEDRELLLQKLLNAICPDLPYEAWRPNLLTEKGRVRSPAVWKLAKLPPLDKGLARVCQLFRARADLLVLTSCELAIWIELKVASGLTTDQMRMQKDIAAFAPLAVPGLRQFTAINVLIQPEEKYLSKHGEYIFSWKDLGASDWCPRLLLPRRERGRLRP